MYIQRIEEDQNVDLLSVMSEASEEMSKLFEGLDSLVTESYQLYMDAHDTLSNIQMESLMEQHFAFMELNESTAVSTLHKSSKTVDGQGSDAGTAKDSLKDKAAKAGATVTRGLQKLAQWIREQIAKMKAFIAKFTSGFTEGYKLVQTGIITATNLYHAKKKSGKDVLANYSKESHTFSGASLNVQTDGDKEAGELINILKGNPISLKQESALAHAQKLAITCSKFYANSKRGFTQVDSMYQKLAAKAGKSSVSEQEKAEINSELAVVKKEQKVAGAFLAATKSALSEARSISTDVIRLCS